MTSRTLTLSIFCGLLYGWLVAPSPAVSPWSLWVFVYDIMPKGAFFAFLIWLPGRVAGEAGLLVSSFCALLSATLFFGFDQASAMMWMAIFPSLFIGYVFCNCLPELPLFFSRERLGLAFIAVPFVSFWAYIEGTMMALIPYDFHLLKYFQGVLDEGVAIIKANQQIFSLLESETGQASLMTDTLIGMTTKDMEAFVLHIFPFPFALIVFIFVFANHISLVLARLTKMPYTKSMEVKTIAFPGGFGLLFTLFTAYTFSQLNDGMAFFLSPLIFGLLALFSLLGFATLHYLLRYSTFGMPFLFLCYALVVFIPPFIAIAFFLGVAEQMFNLRQRLKPPPRS